MSNELKSWSSVIDKVSVASELENVLALNFHDYSRLRTHEVLIELSNKLHESGKSAVIYGVGNIGFKFTHYYNPIATDGKIEGHSNNPANDYDFVVVTNSKFESFKSATNSAILSVKNKHSVPNTEEYNHWTSLVDPKWNGSNFKIPSYCSVGYKWKGNNQKEYNQMELHWLENKFRWEKTLLSKYAPWYSTRIGFPMIQASVVENKLRAGIWQPFHREVNLEKTHEVRISVPEIFGDDERDALQAVRIALALVQSTIGAHQIAILSRETKNCLIDGIQQASKKLNVFQKQNAASRLKTTLHRAKSLDDEMKCYCKIEDVSNPFNGYLSPTEIVIQTLDEIGWGKQVFGKTVKKFLN